MRKPSLIVSGWVHRHFNGSNVIKSRSLHYSFLGLEILLPLAHNKDIDDGSIQLLRSFY